MRHLFTMALASLIALPAISVAIDEDEAVRRLTESIALECQDDPRCEAKYLRRLKEQHKQRERQIEFTEEVLEYARSAPKPVPRKRLVWPEVQSGSSIYKDSIGEDPY